MADESAKKKRTTLLVVVAVITAIAVCCGGAYLYCSAQAAKTYGVPLVVNAKGLDTEKGTKTLSMLLEKIPLKSAVNDRQRQLQMPIERPKMRDTFLRSVLVEHRKFKREAQNAVFVWKINGYKKRVVNKLNKVFGRNKVKS